MHKYIAECIGAFVLTLAVALSLAGVIPSWLPTPLVAGLTLGFLVYVIGRISGAHVNPAITIAVFTVRGISIARAIGYLVAQGLGGGVGWYISGMLGIAPAGGFIDSSPVFPIFFAEVVGSIFFAFGVAVVVFGKIPRWLSGAVVGGSLLLGIVVAQQLLPSGGILNPAVAFGLGSLGAATLLGPIVGAIAGMLFFVLFRVNARCGFDKG